MEVLLAHSLTQRSGHWQVSLTHSLAHSITHSLFRCYPEGGVVLRPWLIYGDRALSAHVSLPLGVLFGPLEYAIK